MKTLFYYSTPLGEIGIAEEGGCITNLFFTKDYVDNYEYIIDETNIHKQAINQLIEYFAKNRRIFTLPLAPEGTNFQMRVWQALCEIPYGETQSYKEIAKIIGNPNGARAVGMANNKNPIPIVIPCHRVIGSNGKLVGYAGGLKIKEYLLNLESLMPGS